MPVVESAQRVDRLAVIGEIDLGESVTATAHDVEGENFVAGCTQLPRDDGAEFAGGSSDGDFHR